MSRGISAEDRQTREILPGLAGMSWGKRPFAISGVLGVARLRDAGDANCGGLFGNHGNAVHLSRLAAAGSVRHLKIVLVRQRVHPYPNPNTLPPCTTTNAAPHASTSW